MKDKNIENLDELISRFYSPPDAEQVKKDIEIGDKIMDLYPADALDEKVKEQIKADITDELKRRNIYLLFGRRAAQAAAVAAAVIVIAFAVLNLIVGKSETRTENRQEQIQTSQLESELEIIEQIVIASKITANGNGSDIFDEFDYLELELAAAETVIQ